MKHRESHAMFELRTDKQHPDGKGLAIIRPSDVLPIHDKEELELQLEHYGRPFISLQLPDSVAARRNYLLYLRPALRYYCAKFGVVTPQWLASDSYFRELPDAEKMQLFGTTHLRFDGAFHEIAKPSTIGRVQ